MTDYSDVGLDLNSNVKVFVRLRPPEGGDVDADSEKLFERDPDGASRKITVRDPKNRHHGEHAFAFDRVFWSDASQEELFDQVATPLIDHCFAGYNSCCFAYGQTGSGKTYSMFGDFGDARGIIPRAGALASCHTLPLRVERWR